MGTAACARQRKPHGIQTCGEVRKGGVVRVWVHAWRRLVGSGMGWVRVLKATGRGSNLPPTVGPHPQLFYSPHTRRSSFDFGVSYTHAPARPSYAGTHTSYPLSTFPCVCARAWLSLRTLLPPYHPQTHRVPPLYRHSPNLCACLLLYWT